MTTEQYNSIVIWLMLIAALQAKMVGYDWLAFFLACMVVLSSLTGLIRAWKRKSS